MPVTLDIKKLKPPTGTRRGAVPWYDHYSDHPSNGLTPQKLAALLLNAERGDMESQAELYEDILDKEPTIFAALDTRKGAVLTKPWELLPLPNVSERKAKKQIERIQKALDRASGAAIVSDPGHMAEYLTFEDLRAYLLDATGRGFVASAVDWDPKTYEPTAFKQFAQKHFLGPDIRTEGNSREYNPYELRLRTEKELSFGEEIKPHQFIFHFSRDKQGLPSRLGLLRTLAWWYLFGNYASKGMIKFTERYGMPLVIGKYGENANEDVRAVIEDAVKNLGQDAAAVIDMSSEIDVMDSGADRKGEIYTAVRHMVNQQISKAILGHASTTESTPGKLGAEDQAMQVQAYRIERDAKALDDTLNSQLIEPMAIWGEGQVYCYIKTRWEDTEDQNTIAERFTKLITAGIDLPKAYVYETLEIPEPLEEEPVFTGQTGGMPGFFSRSKLHANAANKTRAARLRAHEAAMTRERSLEKSALRDLPAIYARLTDGLPMDESAIELMEARKTKFKDALRPALLEIIRDAVEISGTEMRTDLTANVKANAIDPAKFRNMNAVSWIEFQALTLTEIEGENITTSLASRIKDGLVAFEDEGLTPREFYNRIMDSEGVGQIGKGHLKTVLRTNIATARSAGMEIAVQQSPDAFPVWEYLAVGDDRTRDDHMELDGKFFSMNDKRYWPPLGYNCRCEASPVHRDEFEQADYDTTSSGAESVDVPRGWGTDARTNYARWVDKERRTNPELDSRLSSLIQGA